MRRFIASPAIRVNDEAGLALALFTLVVIVLCGVAALSVDTGNLVLTQRNLQDAAKTAALTAARELPAHDAALSMASRSANGHLHGLGYSVRQGTVEVTMSTTYVTNDTVTVTVRRDVPYTLVSVLGLDTATVTATATARAGYLSGSTGVQPWGLLAGGGSSCITLDPGGSLALTHNVTCTLSAGGELVALAMDSPGADELRQNVAEGSSTRYVVGDRLSLESGDMGAATYQGASERLRLPRPAGCPADSFAAVATIAGDGTVAIREGCADHPRILLIPIVGPFDQQGTSAILGFAVMFLEEVRRGQGDGHTEIRGRFIRTTTPLPGAEYNATRAGDASAIMLVD